MPDTTQVSVMDLSIEFIAHKLALRNVLEEFSGVTPGGPKEFSDWVWESPCPLPIRPGNEEDPEVTRAIERAEELEVQWLRAIAGWLTSEADRLDRLAVVR